jgi:hypothetical protein
VDEKGAIGLENHEPVTRWEIARRAAVVLDLTLADDRRHPSHRYG